MDAAEITRAFEAAFDGALVFHAFADYLRDYDLYVFTMGREYFRYRFVHCVSAEVRTQLTGELWSRSLDDAFTTEDLDNAPDDGFVWGVRWQEMHPGLKLVANSARAEYWRVRIGIPFHEAVVESNTQVITLVFADLVVDPVAGGHTPFTIRD
ncbi:hypothetical protein V5P93_005613 [Actinokineospora auranticolor]|uniref:YxiG-like domain-containing protein n=1 Tax=Actinokineospora auranticolor TaxID=155976 RepID=A0A2S6GQ11_9PSEU|nr:hypothetical protein [Actinokineospora auranticolor]PPK67355.1 hypothetical protein CLV40_10718 [Actinokineospora auranticolor]